MTLAEIYLQSLPILLNIMFYLLPIVGAILLWSLWLFYIRYQYIMNIDWLLLEIKIPKEIAKSPAGMEVVFSALHQGGEGSLIDKYIKGKVRSWFAWEIVSFSGEIHFYVRIERKFKDLLEAQIYSQFPEVEVYEAEDYVHQIPYGLPNSSWDLWGATFQLEKPDPYPIKTYIDYELDKERKDPLANIDPITPILEVMGSIKDGEQVWLQIPIMAAKDRKKKQGGKWYEKTGWKDDGKKLIDDIMHRDSKTKAPTGLTSAGFPTMTTLSAGEQDIIKAIERNISKLGFDCGMRIIYFAHKDKLRNEMKAALTGCIKQFNSLNLNGFKPLETVGFDYPWQDFMGKRLAMVKARFFDAYRRRSYFYHPYITKHFVFNTEELATIYHFPGATAKTPTLPRIQSRRAEPPTNLPI